MKSPTFLRMPPLGLSWNTVYRNAQRKFSYPFAGNVGVQVAPIAGVSVAGVKTAYRGRRGSSASCYNRRSISDLGNQAAGAKMGEYFHWHILGDNVKLIARAGLRTPFGTRQEPGGLHAPLFRRAPSGARAREALSAKIDPAPEQMRRGKQHLSKW